MQVEMCRLKDLKRVHEDFLREHGYNHKEWLFYEQDAESYTFYHIKLGRLYTMRR